jgi:hypothetical protein
MFTLNDLRALLQAKPFVPFRIWLSDGRHINVYSAEQVWLFRRYAIIGLLDPNAIDEPLDRHMIVGYMHITRCEELKPGASLFSAPGEPPSGEPTPAAGS